MSFTVHITNRTKNSLTSATNRKVECAAVKIMSMCCPSYVVVFVA